MTFNDPHLIKLFLDLKNIWHLPLQVEKEYELFKEAWAIESLRPKTYEELKTLCQQLWGKSPKEKEKIGQAFQHFTKELKPKFEEENLEINPPKTASQPSTTSQPSPIDLPPKTQSETTQQYISGGENIDEQVVAALPQPTKAAPNISKTEFIRTDEYFDLNRSQLRKGWGSLRKSLRTGKETEPDILATVNRFCQENIAELVCRPCRENQVELLLLIDKGDSMTPFSLIGERLIETAEGIFKSLKVFYFRNSPRNALFADPELLEKHSLDKILTQLHSTRSQVVIFSDGGAREIIPSQVRIDLIQKFIKSLQPTVQQILWLNPLPETDWLGTSAKKISYFVPMFPFSVLGWQELLRMLKSETVTPLPISIEYGRDTALPYPPTIDDDGIDDDIDDKDAAVPRPYIDDESLDALDQVLAAEERLNKYEEAIEILSEFAEDFPEYVNLAFHAAFPLAITPDLLYYLRQNFVEIEDLPWTAVADLLLSSLFEPIGGKLYQMDSSVRHLLLKALKNRFGNERLNKLSDALLSYLQQGLEETIADAEEIGEEPGWIALGYTQPTELAKQLAARLQKSLNATQEDKIKTASLTATFAEALAEEKFQPLLKLARGVARQARGYEELAQEIFRQLEPEVIIEGVKLKVPGRYEPPPKTFTFETVTVNPQGEITHRETKQAQYLTENIGKPPLKMVYIPGGTYTMGSPEGEEGSYDDEKPQHQVTIKPFLMGKYPVTQAQWEAVMGNNPSHFKGENRPVENVSWYDIIEFCARLSQKTGKNYRLPSEAEWEYACRAGTNTPSPFHFGETITTDLANYRGTDNEENKWSGSYGQGPKGIYREETTPVGSFQVANAFGLYDMHGNVWEWCADPWHDSYEGAPTDGRVWDENNNDNHYDNCIDLLVNIKNDERRRLLRGGSWNLNPVNCRAAIRNSVAPDDRNNNLGFRLVCSAAWTP